LIINVQSTLNVVDIRPNITKKQVVEAIRGGTSLSTKLEMHKVRTLPWEKGRWNMDPNFLRRTTEVGEKKEGNQQRKDAEGS
jgi:hypothetical protein